MGTGGLGDTSCSAPARTHTRSPAGGSSPPTREKEISSLPFGQASRVARLYRRLVLLFGVLLILGFLVPAWGRGLPDWAAAVITLAALVGIIAVLIGLLVTSYRLMTHLGSDLPVLWAIGMCIPLANLLVLLAVCSSANSWCKRHGITVGLLGPTKDSLERLRRADV